MVGQRIGDQTNHDYKAAFEVQGLSRAQVAEVLVDLKRRLRGDFYVIEESEERIVLGNRRCPFEEKVVGRPAMCLMTSNVFGVIADDEPLVFHTGQRGMFPLVSEAISKVLPLESIRYVAFSHVEADECGALNQFLAAAPRAVPVASQIAVMVSVNDLADRPARALADGEVLTLGKHALRWHNAPHVPHGWETGFMMETTTRTLLCGDLFTQGGSGAVALTESDILGPSEAFRQPMDYYAHAPHTAAVLEKLALEKPQVLACMHGSAWRGDGAGLLGALARSLGARPLAAAA